MSSSDSWATVNAATPLGLCQGGLSFVTDLDGNYQSFTIKSVTGIPNVPLGALEVPSGGFSVNNTIYTFFITDDSNGALMFGANCAPGTSALVGNTVICPGGRTVLAKQDVSGGQKSTFTPLYYTSQYFDSHDPSDPGAGLFLNIAPVLGKEVTAQDLTSFLPGGLQMANTLFIFGSSNWARLSDVYLAVVGTDQATLEAATKTPQYALGQPWPANWYYFAGLNAGGNPTWTTNVLKAAPLLNSGTAGELSVRYVQVQTAPPSAPSGSWLMLLGGGSGGVNSSSFSAFIATRSAAYPWGPWTAPGVAFDPTLVVPPAGLAGYGNFIYGGADVLSDPGEQAVIGQVYAPYLVPPTLFESTGDPTRVSVSFSMSTLNPYEADLMEMQVGIDSDGDSIPDFADNCPNAANTDQQDSNFLAEQQRDINLNCAVQCPFLPNSAQLPLPTSLGIAEEGRPPRSSDDPGYSAYWQTWYPGDACDPNATTGLTTRPAAFRGYLTPGSQNIRLDGYIGSGTGTAAQAQSTSGVSFCQCPDAANPDATVRVGCLGGRYNCVLAKDSLFPLAGQPAPGSWLRITGFANDLSITHWERSDATIKNNTYRPALVSGDWDWTSDLTEFGISGTQAMNGALWGHVRNDSSAPFQPGAGEFAPTTDTPNAYVAQVLSLPLYPPIEHVSCGEASPLLPLQGSPQPSSPSFACFPPVRGGPIWVSTPLGPIYGVAQWPRVLDLVASGAAHVVVGDDVAAGAPFGFTGTPALVVQTGGNNILGGLQLRNGQIEGVGGVTAPSVGPDPPTLLSYAALDGRLWSMTTISGATTLTRQDVPRALAGQSSLLPVVVVGATPANAQAMVWSRVDGNLWALDLVPDQHGDSHLRLVRIDMLGGAAEMWHLRSTEHSPDALFLSASGQGEILLALSIHGHSEVALLDSSGLAHWSAQIDGTLIAEPVATSEGIGMPMLSPGTAGPLDLDVRFIKRGALAQGLCGSRWLREHARGEAAEALAGTDHRQDCDREDER